MQGQGQGLTSRVDRALPESLCDTNADARSVSCIIRNIFLYLLFVNELTDYTAR